MMKHGSFSGRLAVLAASIAGLLPAPASASFVSEANGYLAVGFAQLFVADAPGGSLSVTGGAAYPITRRLGVGAEIGYHLLGSRNVERGSLVAGVDYSVCEAVAFLHWIPERLGPVGIVSVGPGLMSARAELSTSGGGAGFSDLAVEKLAPAAALDVTLIQRSNAPVRVGIELGTRVGFLPSDTWTLATARVAFHY